MPTEWRAPFRKLQERCSTSWLRLPAWVRGYGDEMIRFAERPYGRVCDTADAADVAFRIRAHDSELEQVKQAVELLTAQGFLSTEQDGLYITNFSKAQENYETARKRDLRDRTRESSGTVRDNPGQSVHVPQEERREEEIREEQTPPKPSPGGEGQIVRRVFEFWQQERRKERAKLERKRSSKIKARLAEGYTPEQLCEAIKNAKNDRFLMGENDRGKVYDDIPTLLRDGPMVDALIALKVPPPIPERRSFGRPPGAIEHEQNGRLPSNYKLFPVVKEVARVVPRGPNRNPKLTAAEIEAQLASATGADARPAGQSPAERERWEREFQAESGGKTP